MPDRLALAASLSTVLRPNCREPQRITPLRGRLKWMRLGRAALGWLFVLEGIASAGSIVVGTSASPGTGTTFTTSSAYVYTIVNTPVTQEIDTYSLELQARMLGGGLLYDQFFSFALGSVTVQNAITAAEGVLTGAGAVSFLGPMQLSSVESLVSSVPNVVQNGTSLSNEILGSDVYIGPQTILIGSFGVCQSYTLDANSHATFSDCNVTPQSFAVAAGGVDVDSTDLSLFNVNQTTTTTNTDLFTQVYEIDGVAGASNTNAVPEPGSTALLLIGLAGLVAFRFCRQVTRPQAGALVAVVVFTSFLVRSASAGPIGLGTTATVAGGETSTTSFVAEVDTIVNTPVTQEIDTYSLELQARVVGGGLLYDQSFSLPLGSVTVQSAIAGAEAVLTGAGAVSFLGPTQLSSVESLVSSVPNVVQNGKALSNEIVGSSVFIGPQTIFVGDFGVCQSYTLDANNHATPSGCNVTPETFLVYAGGVDVDTMTVDLYNVYQTTTTTNTDLFTQVYEIDGVAAASNTSAVPEPGSAALLLIGLAGLGAVRFRRQVTRPQAARLVTIVVFASFLMGSASAGPIGLSTTATVAGGESFTTSAAEVDTIVNTPVTQEIDTYSLELQARMLGGSLLYDQIFSLPLGSVTVQNAITSAENVLTGAGAVSFLGPTQLSSVESLVSSVPNVVQNGKSLSNEIVGSSVFIGPQTILISYFGICQSYTLDANNHATLSGCNGTPQSFTIAAGGADVDTSTVDLYNVNQTTTTTNTDLFTQVYEIDGVAASNTNAVPEPGSAALLLIGLAGLGAFRFRRRVSRPRAARLLTMVVFASFLMRSASAGTIGLGTTATVAGGTSFTTSSGAVDTIVNTPVIQEIATYSLELQARMLGGSLLYDELFSFPLGSVTVQNAITAAEGVLTGAGAVSFLGPTQLSNVESLVTSVTNTVPLPLPFEPLNPSENGSVLAATIIGSSVFIGPQTILIGSFLGCQSYTLNANDHATLSGCNEPPQCAICAQSFSIAAGGVDVDTFTLSLYNVFQTTTTTNTDLFTQVYEIDGVAAASNTNPVPEPSALILVGLGLAVIGIRRRRLV